MPIRPAQLALALQALALLSGLALAQDPSAAPPPPAEYAAPPPPAAAPVRSPGLDEDPHIDRVWFTPTGVTQPAGTTSFNDYELVFIGLTHAFTDNFQLTAIVFPPYVEDLPFIGLLNAKLGLSVTDRFHIAVSGGIGVGHADGETGSVGLVGASASYCTDDPCASLFSAFVYTGFSITEDDNAIPLGYGVSLLQRLSRHVKLAVELASGGAFNSSDIELAEGFLISYGVRFFSENFAIDVGLVRPVFTGDTDFDNPFVLGVPILTASYRWGGR